MKHYFFALGITFFIVLNSQAFNDWGATGHRATGKIAEKHLTNKAKKAIDKLLKGESLAFVSTFADEIKSDRKYNKYSPWHYVNMPLDEQYDETKRNPEGDIIYGINFCIDVLKNKNSTEEDKVFHLKLLVHFLGDLHQPMHIGRAEDKGGNTIQLQWFNQGTNLHRVWDENLIEEWNMSYVELADNAKDLNKHQIEAIKKGSILDWVYETKEITKKVYASVQVGENLRYKYSYDFFPIVREQLQKGGIRLAKILNEIFG